MVIHAILPATILMVMMMAIMRLPDEETVGPRSLVKRVWTDHHDTVVLWCCDAVVVHGPRDLRIRDCVLPAV